MHCLWIRALQTTACEYMQALDWRPRLSSLCRAKWPRAQRMWQHHCIRAHLLPNAHVPCLADWLHPSGNFGKFHSDYRPGYLKITFLSYLYTISSKSLDIHECLASVKWAYIVIPGFAFWYRWRAVLNSLGDFRVCSLNIVANVSMLLLLL